MWKVVYHPEVEYDLIFLGYAEARRILDAIIKRIAQSEPDKTGKTLNGDLAGYRRIRVGQTSIVYRVNQKEIEIFISDRRKERGSCL